jgi:PAS domain S-box-containing protein
MDEKENTRELVVVDLKRYKKVKKALADSEERYRQLFENVPIGIYRTTPDGQIVDSNPALVKMLGYESFAELSKRNLEKEYSNAGSKRSDFIKLLKRHGEVRGLESIWTKKDGSPIYVRENAKLVRDESGKVFFEGTVEDITQGRLAEEANKVRTQQMEILNCIISKGNLSGSLKEMLDVILDCMVGPLAFDMVAIFMLNPETQKGELVAQHGMPRHFAFNEKYLSIDHEPFLYSLKNGEPYFVDDTKRNHPYYFKKWGWRMASSVPLVSKGRVVGALNASSCQRDTFTADERNVLELIGKEAGTLISKFQAENALRESEKYYRTLIDTSPDIIVVMDLEMRMITVNQQFLKVGGYYYDEVIGRCTYDFVAGLDRALLAKRTAKFIRNRRMSGSEYIFKKKDGRAVPLEVSAGFLYDREGKATGIIAIGRDISERKRAEEQLRFLSSITESTSDAIMVTDTNFSITYINKVAEQFFGYTLDELKGKTPGIFNVEPNAAQIQKGLYEIVAAGNTYLGESLNRRKDGSTFFCEYKVMPLKDGDGKVQAYFSVQRDVSERKRGEEELRLSEETFRRTFAAIPSPAFIWKRQADGRILLSNFNLAAEKITQGKIQNYLGIEVDRLYAENPCFAEKIKTVMTKGVKLSEEVLYHYQSTDESRWLLVDYVRNAPDNVMVITRDISGRKESEAKLLAYQEQLRALSSELTLIEERERRRIASELHDQIGQNLALCKLKVAALEKALQQEDAAAELSTVRRLLEVSIQDARSLIFDLSPPVLYELGFPAALEWLAEWIGGRYHVPVEFEDRTDAVSLEGNRRVILFQIVRELLVNMGKHSRASQAKVILSREGRSLKVQVNDDGVGFDAARIDEPGAQDGGFGFFSMRERLNYLGGRMEARSKPRQGTQVTLFVPLDAPGDATTKEDA